MLINATQNTKFKVFYNEETVLNFAVKTGYDE